MHVITVNKAVRVTVMHGRTTGGKIVSLNYVQHQSNDSVGGGDLVAYLLIVCWLAIFVAWLHTNYYRENSHTSSYWNDSPE